MRILPIQSHSKMAKTSFKGYFVEGATDNWSHNYQRENSGRRCEQTLGSYHAGKTGKFYYADPLEIVTDSVKEQADFVIYDDEPPFPNPDKDLSQIYFHQNAHYSIPGVDKLKRSGEYFYRMEMADKKTLAEYENNVKSGVNLQDSIDKANYYRGRIADAQYNQETIGKSLEIIEKSKQLREERAKNRYEMCFDYDLGYVISDQMEKTYKNRLEELNNYAEQLPKDIHILEENKEYYEKINKNLEKYNNDHKVFYEKNKNFKFVRMSDDNKSQQEENDIKTFINLLAEKIENKKEELIALQTRIANNKQYFEKHLQFAELWKKNGADLIPHFHELKEYMQSRGYKVIKQLGVKL